jgi:hypothetical protein
MELITCGEEQRNRPLGQRPSWGDEDGHEEQEAAQEGRPRETRGRPRVASCVAMDTDTDNRCLPVVAVVANTASEDSRPPRDPQVSEPLQ